MINKKLLGGSIFAASILIALTAAASTGTVKTISYNPLYSYDQVWLNGVSKFCELSDNNYENQARIRRADPGASEAMKALLAAKLSGNIVYIETFEDGDRCIVKTVELR